jgi:predicted membrane protein
MAKLTSRQIALIAVFAALYVALSIVTPVVLVAVGISNLTIAIEAFIATIFGLILGPYLGFTAALAGTSIAWILPPSSGSPYGLPFILSPPLNALVAGFIYYRKWKYAFATLGILTAAFLFLPPSQPFGEFWYISALVVWDKVIALLLIIPTAKLAKRLSSPKLIPILYFLIGFIGNQADNMWGTDIYAVPVVYNGIFGFTLETVRVGFTISPLFYPAIRILQAIFVAIVAVPLILRLKNTGWVWKEETIID